MDFFILREACIYVYVMFTNVAYCYIKETVWLKTIRSVRGEETLRMQSSKLLA